MIAFKIDHKLINENTLFTQPETDIVTRVNARDLESIPW
jgi:hypothetical protein